MIDEKRKEEMKEVMERFIFDPSKVQRKVAYVQFRINESEMGFGTFLPGIKDVLNKKGEVIGQEQTEFPVVITSNRRLYPVTYNRCEDLKVRFRRVPSEMTSRWALNQIKEYLEGKSGKVDSSSLFNQIRECYKEHIYMRPEWYTIHALWDMGTYFTQLFHAYPYIELRGSKSTGKTKLMTLSSCLTFNATNIMSSPTESTLFRETDSKRPATYLDEAENLFQTIKGRVVHDGRVEVLNSGYSAEGVVPRMEQRGKKWVMEYYRTYSPKMISSINGLRGATESRAIVRTMTRALDNDERGEKEIERLEPRWQSLRNDLHLFMMQEWRAVLDQYEAFLKQNPTKLKKRDFQLWRPLLALAKVIGEEVYAEALVTAQRLQDVNKADEFSEGSWEYHLLKQTYQLMKGGSKIVLYKDLREALPSDESLTLPSVKRVMDGLGFRDYKGAHTREGNGYEIPLIELEKVIQTNAPSINIFTSSQSSQEEEFIDGENNSDTVKVCEERPFSVKKKEKDCEEMKLVKIVKQKREVPLYSALTKNDLLDALKNLKTPQCFTDIELLFPREPVLEWLMKLKAEGEVMENPKDVWGVLR